MEGKYLSERFFSRLESLALHLQADLTGYFGGQHLIKKYGQTLEFADFREYQLGDDIRRIDWNLYARLGKYFLKLFNDERQMHIHIFFDCSKSMNFDNEKAEYALGVATSLGFLAIHNTDKVTYHLMKNNCVETPYSTIVGKTMFYNNVGKLKNIKFAGETDFFSAITKMVDVGVNDSLAIIISDFFTESDWKTAIDYLLYKKQQILLIQILSPMEISPDYSGRYNLIDAETSFVGDVRNIRIKITRSMLNDYQTFLQKYIQNIREFCISRGVTSPRRRGWRS